MSAFLTSLLPLAYVFAGVSAGALLGLGLRRAFHLKSDRLS